MKNPMVFDFTVDKANNRIHVDRSFEAPLELVWAAWTDPEILDQWWAPLPYRNVTVAHELRPGGRWMYYMISPQDEKHYCLFEYSLVEPMRRYAGTDAFCDPEGNISDTMPRCTWENSFEERGDHTIVHCVLQYATLADLERIIEMGFREGFTMGMGNLDAYISAQFYLRKSKKPNRLPRVSTYVNFPGNTEEAMQFYRSVFRTEFVQGIQRFGDIPPDPAQPPMSDALKDLVLHVELPLLGGHILMATDAPKEMGFTVTPGNNMHINLEPDSRAEADRLFQALSAGGNITMPMQDMFWGAYFGSVIDKYGISWMVNHQP